MVIANRCMQREEGLVKQKAQLSEAAQANQRLTTIANELTQDKDRVVGEQSSLKADMAAKDEELRKALADYKSANERLKMLTSQTETIKTSTVEEFKSSEAYDDNNTKYFLAGFELLKKQAKEKYPDLDFEVFQPYEDDESVIPVEDGNEGTTSADPQVDDDATS
jgi:chromosome segregation ATPase